MSKVKRSLTKAEEQVMQVLWQQEQAFLKDLVEAMPLPTPHPNTVATILKILMEKGFVKAEAIGRNNLYKPAITKDAYSKQSLGLFINNYFNGSYSNAVSFLVDQKKLSVQDLELLLQQLKQKEE
jgi:BlaI family transcriptional regulator, penicillinase repressor